MVNCVSGCAATISTMFCWTLPVTVSTNASSSGSGSATVSGRWYTARMASMPVGSRKSLESKSSGVWLSTMRSIQGNISLLNQ